MHAVRIGTERPLILHTTAERRDATVLDETIRVAGDLSGEGSAGRIAVIGVDAAIAALAELFDAHDVSHGVAPGDGLNQTITLVPASIIKGLEVDTVIVVEPSDIATTGERGLRTLYVALTRPTRSLVIVHADDLPECLAGPGVSSTPPTHRSVKAESSVAVSESASTELIGGV